MPRTIGKQPFDSPQWNRESVCSPPEKKTPQEAFQTVCGDGEAAGCRRRSEVDPFRAAQKIDNGSPQGAEKAARLQGVARTHPLGDDAHPETADRHAAAEDESPNAHQSSPQMIGGLGLNDAVADGKK